MKIVRKIEYPALRNSLAFRNYIYKNLIHSDFVSDRFYLKLMAMWYSFKDVNVLHGYKQYCIIVGWTMMLKGHHRTH